MAKRINGPVGSWRKRALNRSADVTTIQELLTAAAKATKNNAFDPRGVDGNIARPPRSSATVKAIRAFQSTFMRSPDGIISPGKRTMQKLLKHDIGQPSEPATSKPKVSSDCVFPLAFVPAKSYKTGGMRFGAKRSNPPYQRRDDLMNPTTYLDKWKTNLPTK